MPLSYQQRTVGDMLASGVGLKAGDASSSRTRFKVRRVEKLRPPKCSCRPLPKCFLRRQSISFLRCRGPLDARRSKLTFAKSTPEAAGVKVGDVVVADVSNNTPSGFIGKVINVHKSGTVVVIEAGPASLADALTSAQISISRTLTAADMTLGLPLSVSHS